MVNFVIKRTVFYYQISWINQNGETVFKDKQFFYNFFSKILVKEDEEAYLISLEEKKLNNNQEKSKKDENDDWIFGILSKTKKTDFPMKQNLDDGVLSSLDLKENEGLYYPTHFAIYGGTILITEFNFDSLRPNFYIKKKINDILGKREYEVKEINIKPVIRKDIEEILNSDLREIQLSIAPTKRSVLKENSDLSEMFKDIEKLPDLTLNIGFSMGKRRSNKYYKEFDNIKRLLLNMFKKDKLNSFDKVLLKRKTSDKIESINLLDQIFKTDEEFIKSNDRNKAIDSEDAFKKFKIIYKNNKSELDDMIIR